MARSPAEAASPQRFAGLWARVISALVLAALGGSAIWFGFPWFELLVAIATTLMIGEWRRICGGWRNPAWLVAGIAYIGASVLGLLWLRNDPPWGQLTVLWLVFVVAATDIGAYFAGKSFGGARLAPRLSPGKTWSGLGGGLMSALVVAGAFSIWIPSNALKLCLFGLLIGIVSQLGDLLESAVKRKFGFKDAGRLIPGHGGLLDRVDGLAAAALFLSLVRLLQDRFAPWN